MKGICTTLTLCLLYTLGQAQDLGQWMTRQALPSASQEMPHAVLGGKVYVPGGLLETGGASTKVEVFDPATNTWSALVRLPFAMHHLGAAAVGGTFYIIGGYQGNQFLPTNRVLAYEPIAQRWVEKAPMPRAHGAHVVVSMEDKIYAIGGVSTGGVQNTNLRYDPAANTWEARAPMPSRREHLAAAVIDSLIYVVGGRTPNGGNTALLEVYSPATNTWRKLADMPTPRGGLTAASLHGKLYVFGGEAFNIPFPGVFEQVEEYDPVTDTWRTMAPMPMPRHGIGAAVVADTIFVIGGGPVAGFGVTDINAGFIPPNPKATAAETDAVQPKPPTFAPNYPNPFSGSTTLTFSLSEPETVHLAVYDLIGREVAVVVTGRYGTGMHRVDWRPRQVPPGVYIARLQAGSSVFTRRLVLI